MVSIDMDGVDGGKHVIALASWGHACRNACFGFDSLTARSNCFSIRGFAAGLGGGREREAYEPRTADVSLTILVLLAWRMCMLPLCLSCRRSDFFTGVLAGG